MQTFTKVNPIAYFCAEYAVAHELPFYAGGLGVLAGDTLKAAADAGIHMVGIGLLYRGHDAKQIITQDAEQVETEVPVDPLVLGLQPVLVEEQPVFVKVHLSTADVWLKCWQYQVGDTVTLYLLDSDTEHNHHNERALTHSLYSGTEDWQFKQQLLLGIGGVKLLHALGIHPAVYHLNEGRPAFLHWQLIRSYMDTNGLSYEQAKAKAIAKTVYTNHTLVGAGNPGYPSSLVHTFGSYYAEKMGVTVDRLAEDGVEHGDTDHFQITRMALNVSRKANGVSKLHTQFSAQQWPEYNWTPITNGVYLPYWQDESIQNSVHDPRLLWNAHLEAKKRLQDFTHERTGFSYNSESLVVSWARRITGYKQLDKVFADISRLREILSDKDMPVQLLVAGKAHFGDSQSKAFIHDMITIFANELNGHALFIPDYNVEVARHMVQGSDVWLNTPEYGKEASGTSGMKALANGVLNCSVADGWAPELDWEGKGWIIDHTDLSNSVYSLLQNDIKPLYYAQKRAFETESTSSDESSELVGGSRGWVQMMQSGIAHAHEFSAARMVQQYLDDLYY